MWRRSLAVFLGACLWVGVSSAIGEVTPTPSPNQAPNSLPVPATPNPQVLSLLDEALSAIQAQDFATALSLSDEAIALDANNPQAYFLRGVVYAQQNRLRLAIDDYTRAIGLRSWEWTYYAFRADAFLLDNDPSSALTDYDRAIELNPRYTQAFQGRAFAHQLAGEDLEAEMDSLIAQGLQAYDFGDFQNAIFSFTQALDLSVEPLRPKADAYYNRGLSAYLSQDPESALQDYSMALEIYPNMHDAYLGRGIVNRESGNLLQAGRDFLRRIELLEDISLEDTIQVGETRQIVMTYGAVYRLRFEVGADTFVTFRASNLPDISNEQVVDPLIVVIAPDGTALAGDDDFGGGSFQLDSLIEGLRLSQAGVYTLVVSHANGGFDGIVEISLE